MALGNFIVGFSRLRFAWGCTLFLLVGFLWCRPFDLSIKIKALRCNPLVESLVELFIVYIEGGFAFPSLYGENFGFALFPVLAMELAFI